MKVSLGPAKGKDSATTLGPWLVTADELEPYRDADGFLALDMRCQVNDVEIGQDLLSNMGWPFEELISYASRGTWVRAGDVLGSGTCGNGGCLAELWGRRGEPGPSAAAARRRRRDDRRGHRHHPQPRRRRGRPAAGRGRPAEAAGPEARAVSGRVAGKVVVVTGAGQGQGAAEARLLAAEGATVIGCDLKPEPAEELPGVEYRQLDVTDAAAGRRWPPTWTGVDGLVANAGVTWRARLADLDPADLARVSEVNVTGTLLGIQALTPLMRDGGSVVVVGSVAALTGHFPVAYTASKWALRGLAKAACLELGPRGIRVNTVHPGLHRDADDRLGRAGVPRRQRRRDPARPHRHRRRGRAARALPRQRRGLLHLRRGDPRRRRHDRPRRREVDQRRRPRSS